VCFLGNGHGSIAGAAMPALESIHPAMLASFVAAAVACAGIVLTLVNRSWTERHSDGFTAFASGLLIATAVLHLIPESLAATDMGPWLILAGYLILFTTGLIFGVNRKTSDRSKIAVTAPILGIAFHSFVDGLEYPVLFKYDIFSGLMATSGLILHELAEGVVVFALLRRAKVGTPIAVVLALIAAALTTPIGAFVSLQFVSTMSDETVGMLMSLAAGALLYVGAGHLPQHIQDKSKTSLWLIFLAGILLASLLTLSHNLEGGHAH